MLDDELVSAPSINYQENPDGIDGAPAPRSPAASRSSRRRTSRRSSRSARCRSASSWSRASQVSASLGAQALDEGLLAGAAGFAIVALFLIVFYRVLGVIAVVAMAIYALYFYALVKLIPITLTLPGIAGLILTLGVAADANIVIFERVKEEMRGGRIGRPGDLLGLQEGPDGDPRREHRHGPRRLHPLRAGDGGRPGLRAHARRRRHPVALHRRARHAGDPLRAARHARCCARSAALGARDSKPVRFDFMGKSRWFFSMSGVILLICAIAIAVNGLNFGIDFEGGTRITAPLERGGDRRRGARRARTRRARRRRDPDASQNAELGDNVVQISAEELEPDEVDAGQQRAATTSSGSPGTRASSRSARASARRSPTARSSRSSPR